MVRKLVCPLNLFQGLLSLKAWITSILRLMMFIAEKHAYKTWVARPQVRFGLRPSYAELSVFIQETSVDKGLWFWLVVLYVWWCVSCTGTSFDSTSSFLSFPLCSDFDKASFVFWVICHLAALSMGCQLRWSSGSSLTCPPKVFLLSRAILPLME